MALMATKSFILPLTPTGAPRKGLTINTCDRKLPSRTAIARMGSLVTPVISDAPRGGAYLRSLSPSDQTYEPLHAWDTVVPCVEWLIMPHIVYV